MTAPDPDKTLVSWALADLRRFNAAMCREEATVVLAMWEQMVQLRKGSPDTAAEVTALVLSHFSPAEPPNVPGLDWLADAKADAAVLVAETVAALDEPKARRWRDRDGQFWQVGDDELISLETERGPSRLFVLATVEELAELYGPLVEVVPQPTAEARVDNACTCGHAEPEHISGVCMSETVDEYCPCGSYARAAS